MNAFIRTLALILAPVVMPLFAPVAAADATQIIRAQSRPVVKTGVKTSVKTSVIPTASSMAATISGIVFDSIARAPLAGATVQLVAASGDGGGKSATSDASGAFIFSNVPEGKYTIGFFHPMLDSLGLEPILHTVAVESGTRGVRVDLAIPSPARLRATICASGVPVTSTSAPPSLVMGFVRNASDLSPAVGAAVAGQWSEFSIGRGGIARTTPRRVATTGDNGWFAICGVPSPGTVLLTAGRGADSTDAIEAEVPANGFLRRDLYIGTARPVAVRSTTVRDSASGSDSTTLAPVRVNVGTGRLSGTVFTSVGSRPLAGAQVGIVNGPSTRANESGEWTLVNAPTGTRTLEVRAVGHYPVRRAVDVVSGTPPMHVALATLKSVLDTMKVTAAALSRNGFVERSRSSMGRFLTQTDIARRAPNVTSDLFRSMPGVYLEIVQDSDTASIFAGAAATSGATPGAADTKIVMRGTFSERCVPAIYLNGNHMPNLSATDIDDLMRPGELKGVEVYSPTQVPSQFKPPLSGCGAIVFWTR